MDVVADSKFDLYKRFGGLTPVLSDVVDEWTTAYDQRQREPTRSEPADFGGGESTGVQDLD
jgi:hypothetical protein